MNQNLKYTISAIVLVAVGGALIWGFSTGYLQGVFSNTAQNISESDIVLFYGEGCPHCEAVEEFIKDNKIDDKIKITRLEVPFGNKTNDQLLENAKVLLDRVNKCNLNVQEVGIPFLWDGAICIVGDQPVIEFFKQKANLE